MKKLATIALSSALALGVAAPIPAMAQNVNGEQNLNSSRGLIDDDTYKALADQLILSSLPIAAPLLLSSFFTQGINPRY